MKNENVIEWVNYDGLGFVNEEGFLNERGDRVGKWKFYLSPHYYLFRSHYKDGTRVEVELPKPTQSVLKEEMSYDSNGVRDGVCKIYRITDNTSFIEKEQTFKSGDLIKEVFFQKNGQPLFIELDDGGTETYDFDGNLLEKICPDGSYIKNRVENVKHKGNGFYNHHISEKKLSDGTIEITTTIEPRHGYVVMNGGCYDEYITLEITKPDGVYEKYLNGILVETSDDDIQIEYWENGNVQEITNSDGVELFYKSGKLESRLTTNSNSIETYFESGELQSKSVDDDYESYYLNGQLKSIKTDDKEEHYYETGELQKKVFDDGSYEEYFTNGVVSKRGSLDGTYTLFDEEGNTTEICSLKVSKSKKNKSIKQLQDDFISGSSNTSDITIEPVIKEIQYEVRTFHSNGRIKEEGSYSSNQQKNGTWKSYSDDGILESELKYKWGELTGKGIHYHSNGRIKEKGSYRNNQQSGLWEFYYPNGNILKKCKFRKNQDDSLCVGDFIQFHSNGNPKSIGTYDNSGYIVGVWKYFDELGNLIREEESGYGDWYDDMKIKTYYPNNQLKEDFSLYQFHIRQGRCIKYWDNGNVMSEGRYQHSGDGWNRTGHHKTDTWEYYSRDGGLVKMELYSETGKLEQVKHLHN